MNIPQCGIKLHSGNFSAIGKILQEQLSDGKCLRLQVKEWREKRSLSQNALSHMWYAEISEYLINSGRTDATPEWVKRIRDRWQKLRLLRSRGTVLVDYKILRNFVRIYQTLGETA